MSKRPSQHIFEFEFDKIVSSIYLSSKFPTSRGSNEHVPLTVRVLDGRLTQPGNHLLKIYSARNSRLQHCMHKQREALVEKKGKHVFDTHTHKWAMPK